MAQYNDVGQQNMKSVFQHQYCLTRLISQTFLGKPFERFTLARNKSLSEVIRHFAKMLTFLANVEQKRFSYQFVETVTDFQNIII